jgi:hypothetical protein
VLPYFKKLEDTAIIDAELDTSIRYTDTICITRFLIDGLRD